ncbi:MAG: phosphoesterase [Candidatus Competibacteraceae bacterium]|nr:phosphoesterase [Candidatus Competibacteraceae bacterium]
MSDPTPNATTWRYTAKYPRAFWVLDARLAWPVLLWLAHLSPWTLALALAAVALNALLLYRALPVPMALRRLKAGLRGWPRLPRRPQRLFTQ